MYSGNSELKKFLIWLFVCLIICSIVFHFIKGGMESTLFYERYLEDGFIDYEHYNSMSGSEKLSTNFMWDILADIYYSSPFLLVWTVAFLVGNHIRNRRISEAEESDQTESVTSRRSNWITFLIWFAGCSIISIVVTFFVKDSVFVSSDFGNEMTIRIIEFIWNSTALITYSSPFWVVWTAGVLAFRFLQKRRRLN